MYKHGIVSIMCLGTFVGSQAGNKSPSLVTSGDSGYRNFQTGLESNRMVHW